MCLLISYKYIQNHLKQLHFIAVGYYWTLKQSKVYIYSIRKGLEKFTLSDWTYFIAFIFVKVRITCFICSRKKVLVSHKNLAFLGVIFYIFSIFSCSHSSLFGCNFIWQQDEYLDAFAMFFFSVPAIKSLLCCSLSCSTLSSPPLPHERISPYFQTIRKENYTKLRPDWEF